MKNTKAEALKKLVAAGYNAEMTKDGLNVTGEGWSVHYSDLGQDCNTYTGNVPAEVEELAVWDDPTTRVE